MFSIVPIKTVVKIVPWKLENSVDTTIKSEINFAMSNKVIFETGLVMALYDVAGTELSAMLPNDGNVYVRVACRLIIFRPFLSEVVHGKVKCSTSQGIQLSLGFFDDIFVPPLYILHPSYFDEVEQLWVWLYKDEDDEISKDGDFDDDADGKEVDENCQKEHKMHIDTGADIRFRVIEEHFEDTTPHGPGAEEQKHQQGCPYKIIAAINEPGLGLLAWWS